MIKITDDMDVACFSLVWNGDVPNINPVSSVDLAALPEFVTETTNIGSLCMHNEVLYGCSPEHLLGNEVAQ